MGEIMPFWDSTIPPPTLSLSQNQISKNYLLYLTLGQFVVELLVFFSLLINIEIIKPNPAITSTIFHTNLVSSTLKIG